MVARPGRGGRRRGQLLKYSGSRGTSLLMDSMWAVREREEPKLTPRAVFAYGHINFIACLLSDDGLSDLSLCFQKKKKKRQWINKRNVQLHFCFLSYLPNPKLQRQRWERQNWKHKNRCKSTMFKFSLLFHFFFSSPKPRSVHWGVLPFASIYLFCPFSAMLRLRMFCSS